MRREAKSITLPVAVLAFQLLLPATAAGQEAAQSRPPLGRYYFGLGAGLGSYEAGYPTVRDGAIAGLACRFGCRLSPRLWLEISSFTTDIADGEGDWVFHLEPIPPPGEQKDDFSTASFRLKYDLASLDGSDSTTWVALGWTEHNIDKDWEWDYLAGGGWTLGAGLEGRLADNLTWQAGLAYDSVTLKDQAGSKVKASSLRLLANIAIHFNLSDLFPD